MPENVAKTCFSALSLLVASKCGYSFSFSFRFTWISSIIWLDTWLNSFNVFNSYINPIQDELFQGCSRMRGGFLPTLPKICHTYPTMMKLGRVIPYPRRTQTIYKSRDTSLDTSLDTSHATVSWRQHFFTRNQQIWLHQETQI